MDPQRGVSQASQFLRLRVGEPESFYSFLLRVHPFRASYSRLLVPMFTGSYASRMKCQYR